MNRLALQTRVQNYLQNSVYYDTNADLNNSIQDGMDEIACLTGCIFKTATLPFTQYTTYYDIINLLGDYLGLFAMYNAVINRWMWPITLKKLNQARIDWDSIYGTPYWFCPVSHRYVAIWMKPGTVGYGNMYVYYVAQAPQLTDSTNIPIPDEHIKALEDYVVCDMQEQAQEFTKASPLFDNYKTTVENLRVLMKNKRNSDRYPGLH